MKVPVHFMVSLMVDVGDKTINTKEELQVLLNTQMFNYKPLVYGHTSEHTDVQMFHRKFGVPIAGVPSLLGGEALQFRSKFLSEEKTEFDEAIAEGDLPKAADALVDLVYVAQGTADMMCLPWKLLWSEVQKKNMMKERAQHASQSARGTKLDVIKPHGWTPPDHTQFVGYGPWPVFTGE